jgi:lipopolysaccharide transport system ATP-binding protein
MGHSIISVEQVGKKYLLRHHEHAPYTALRDVIVEKAMDVGRRITRTVQSKLPGQSFRRAEEFWALRNVTFEVKRGERIGIIGRNGAGKSTLLKVLSRITEPTEGRILLKGRVASLLEVGTGFHPELTGRENIFLNGAILGMKQSEIRRKFDEIVAFAEVEKFLDTPVKHYSSGMYVRLAFAVAAHLEPEILIVDEVLAVGDAAFQRKCLGKMEEVTIKEGRTILFVSHNMSAIQSLCQRAIWLDGGKIVMFDDTNPVVEAYGKHLQSSSAHRVMRSIDGQMEIEQVATLDKDGNATSVFSPGKPLTLEIRFLARQPIPLPYLWIGIQSQFGSLFCANMLLDGARPKLLSGRGVIRCKIGNLPLLPGQTYGVILGGRKADGFTPLFQATEAAHFLVSGSPREIGLNGDLADSLVGQSSPVLVPYTWCFPDGETVSLDFRAV